MSSPEPPDNSPSLPKGPIISTSKAGTKASDNRVAPSTSLFGPFTIPIQTSAPEPAKHPNTKTPTPGTTYGIKTIYIHAPNDVVDFNNYIGTRAQTKQAIESLIDQARTGNRTTDEGVIEHVEGSECNVQVADDGMSFEVFAYGWEGWVARVWAEEKDGDGREYRTAFG